MWAQHRKIRKLVPLQWNLNRSVQAICVIKTEQGSRFPAHGFQDLATAFQKTTGSYGVSGSSHAAILIAQIHLSQTRPQSPNDHWTRWNITLNLFRGSENKLLRSPMNRNIFFRDQFLLSLGDFLHTYDLRLYVTFVGTCSQLEPFAQVQALSGALFCSTLCWHPAACHLPESSNRRRVRYTISFFRRMGEKRDPIQLLP